MNSNKKKRTFQKDLKRLSTIKWPIIIMLFTICTPLMFLSFLPPTLTAQEAEFDYYLFSPNYFKREIKWSGNDFFPYIDIWVEFEADDELIVYVFNSNQFDQYVEAKNQGYSISHLDCIICSLNSRSGILSTNVSEFINPLFIIIDANGNNGNVSFSYKITLFKRGLYIIFYILSLIFVISSIVIYYNLKNPISILSNPNKNQEILEALDEKNFFEKDKEKKIFEENMISLRYFEYVENYKYCLISMGAILEFLIIRYSKMNNLDPVDINGKIVKDKDAKFYHYTQTLINNDTLNQKKSWIYVQNHIRDFRNYIHIIKEMNEEKIDKTWYNNAKLIYKKILKGFIP